MYRKIQVVSFLQMNAYERFSRMQVLIQSQLPSGQCFSTSFFTKKNSWKVSKYFIYDKFSYCPSNMKAKSRQWPAASCHAPYLTVLILLF